jgi:hypothetical protein
LKPLALILFFLTSAASFSLSPDTLYPVKVFTNDGYKYGYINQDGNLNIKPVFAYARGFSEGKAFVKLDNNSASWLCINTGNAVLFEIEAEYAFDFKYGLARMINKSDSTFFIDSVGRKNVFRTPPIDFEAKKLLIPFFDNIKWGYGLGPEVVVLPAIYERAGEFSEGLAPVFYMFKDSDLPDENAYNAFINENGGVVIKTEIVYDDHGHISSGYFYSPEKWQNGVCRYYTSNDPNTRAEKYVRSDGKVIW